AQVHREPLAHGPAILHVESGLGDVPPPVELPGKRVVKRHEGWRGAVELTLVTGVALGALHVLRAREIEANLEIVAFTQQRALIVRQREIELVAISVRIVLVDVEAARRFTRREIERGRRFRIGLEIDEDLLIEGAKSRLEERRLR